MLQQEVFALRYGENAAKLRSLALEGASRAELAQVRALMLQRDALERNKQAILDAAEAEKRRRDNATRSAQALTESVRTPAEVFRGKVREIYKLSQQQAISAETEKRALTAARQEFMQTSGATSSAPSSPQHAQALFDSGSRQQFFSRLQERAAEMQKQQQARQRADSIQKEEGRNAIQQAAQGSRRGKGDDRDLVRRDTQRNSLLKQIADRLEKNEEEPQGKVSIR